MSMVRLLRWGRGVLATPVCCSSMDCMPRGTDTLKSSADPAGPFSSMHFLTVTWCTVYNQQEKEQGLAR